MPMDTQDWLKRLLAARELVTLTGRVATTARSIAYEAKERERTTHEAATTAFKDYQKILSEIEPEL